MRIRLPLLLVLIFLLLLPLSVAAEPAAPDGVSNFSVQPDPARKPTSGTIQLTVSVSAQITAGDGATGFCVYGPQTGYTYPATITLTHSAGFTTTPVTFNQTDVGTTCPADYGTGVYYSVGAGAPDGNYAGTFKVTVGTTATRGTTAWYLLLEEPTGSPNPATDNHTLEGPLAVNIVNFSANASSAHEVKIEWASASETNNVGFNLYRSRSEDAPSEQLNSSLIASQALGSSEGHRYEWADSTVETGQSYYYWLEDVATDGTRTMSGPVSVTPEAPTAVELASLRTANPLNRTLPWVGLSLLGLAAVAIAWRRRR